MKSSANTGLKFGLALGFALVLLGGLSAYAEMARTKAERLALAAQPAATSGSASLLAYGLAGLGLLLGLGMLGLLLRELSRSQEKEEQTTAELARVREQLRTVLSNVGEAVVITDRGGHIEWLNEAANALTGWTQSEATGKSSEQVLRTLPPAPLAPATAGLPTETARVPPEDPLLLAKDGRRHPIKQVSAPIRLGGRVVGGVLVVRDLSESRSNMEALRRSEERFGLLVEKLKAHAVFAIDPQKRANMWNEGVRRVLGVEVLDFLGQDVTRMIYSPEDLLAGAAKREFDAAATTGSSSDDRWIPRRGGGRFWAACQIIALHDARGGILGYIVAITDQSATRQATDEVARLLLRDDRRSKRLQQVASASLSLSSPRSIADLCDAYRDQARKLLDASRAEVELGKDRDEKSFGNLAAVLIAPSGRRLGHVWAAGKTGGQFSLDDEAILIEIAQYTASALDNLRLETELTETRRQLDEFLSALPREMRASLSNAGTALEIMQHSGDNLPALQGAREIVERHFGRLSGLGSDLLDLAELAHGSFYLQSEYISLAAAIRPALESCRSRIAAQGHSLTVKPAPDSLMLDGDTRRIAQVVAILLDNAARYTDAGGQIELVVRASDAEATIAVRDSGIGIAVDEAPRIYDRFMRGARAREFSPGGLGIGLSLARGIMELHQGSIEAHSEGPGRGSEFILRLPRDAHLPRGA